MNGPIGEGGFAKVYKHIKSHDEGAFAVKKNQEQLVLVYLT